MQPLWICLAWLAGNVLVHSLAALPGMFTLAALVIVGGIAAVRCRVFWPLAFVLGFAWTSHAAHDALAVRLPAELDRHDVRLSGWIDDFPQIVPGHVQFSMSIDDAELPLLIGTRVRLNWYDPEFELRPGQQLCLTARLRTPRGLVNPAGSDYGRWLMLERYSATGYVRSVDDAGDRRDGFAPWLLGLRARIRERITAHLRSATAAGLTTALAIGERSGLRDRDWDVFRRTGTSHLVAISGLHVGLVALTALWIAYRMMRSLGGWFVERCSGAAAVTALLAAVFYAALAGFSVSALRAILMLAAATLIAGMRRQVSRFHALSLSAVVITAIDPLATLGRSFWLSFGAVATLLVAAAPQNIVVASSRPLRWLHGAVRLQLAIALVAVPAGAAFFGEFSLIAFAVNLAAIPFFGLVLVPLILLSVVCELTLGAPEWLWDTLGWLAGGAMSVLVEAASVPGASIKVAVPDIAATVLALAGVVLMLAWNPLRSRFIGALALAPLVWPSQEALPDATFRLTILDVGHGLAVIVETRSYTLIYDAGARFNSGFDIGSDVIVPALRGRRAPETMIVSHADNDHSGGAASVIAAWPDIAVLAGPDVQLPGARACVAGLHWTRDGVDFDVLHPPADSTFSGNDGSCVLRVSSPGGSALLTGDIERAGERAVLDSAGVNVDIVIAPHHGSETSSSEAFVTASSPSIVVFSAAYGNRWGFPRDLIVARWCAAGADIYVTGEDGAVKVTAGTGPPRIAALRSEARHYWRAISDRRCGESPDVTL